MTSVLSQELSKRIHSIKQSAQNISNYTGYVNISNKVLFLLCSSRKYPYPPHERSLEIPRGWGSQKPQFLKERMGFNRIFQRGGGGILPSMSMTIDNNIFKMYCGILTSNRPNANMAAVNFRHPEESFANKIKFFNLNFGQKH